LANLETKGNMMKDKSLTPLYARYLVRLTRPFPDFDFFFIKPLRKKAVELLNLKHGDRVLDMGCGMGGSFPFLVHSVGASGEVVGVEISPEVTINTRKRVAKNNWENIRIIEDAAQTVNLSGMFDGLLMFAAPDVYASREALENIIPYLKDNSRVALFGARTSNSRLGKVLNSVLRLIFSKLSFATTPGLNARPWQMLEKYTEKLEVEKYFFGWMFLASGYIVKKG
jgi:ubiquinone/menaquinone biosynthesis C-methylase UbiE